ncbi:hypothetical protein EVAR_8765_1 [Eumeta japonica]|uniref:Uncharacterized protein n=1 Tax=Eumeta variegata TaxID=151549 RepID=A0A4C1TTQ9_EUMVA|nr:hypothetical protein EVAR_8765_1 [Eumeta japonica]
MAKVKDGIKFEIGTRTGTVENENEIRDCYYNGYVSIVDTKRYIVLRCTLRRTARRVKRFVKRELYGKGYYTVSEYLNEKTHGIELLGYQRDQSGVETPWAREWSLGASWVREVTFAGRIENLKRDVKKCSKCMRWITEGCNDWERSLHLD